jgi:extracellular factor (EF) 3-hydroxypalmitic acid methyl ester biosynthesis protein
VAKSYEELVGSLGRAVYFRPERQNVRELLSRDSEPRLQIEKQSYPVFDVSMNGLSFLAPVDSEWPVGRELPSSVFIHDEEVFVGRARVARREMAGSRALVGLAIIDGFLDLPQVLRRDEERRLDKELKDGPVSTYAKLPADFREAVNRASHFLQYFRLSLARHESRYREHGGNAAEDVEALAQRSLDALRAPWAEIVRVASETSAPCFEQPDVLRAAKSYTETMVTPHLMECPMPARAYRKPLGYPGDYQVMLYYYENALRGQTAFSKVFHKLHVEHPLSHGCRTRKTWTMQLMSKEQAKFAAASPSEPFRAMSLGCGPAREIPEFIAQYKSWSGSIVWSLLDQEEEALSVAYRDSQTELHRSDANAQVQCLHISFSQLINDPTTLPLFQPQNFIYSVGLFDYLRESKAQELIASLYSRLAPGGLLTIGNAKGPNNYFWSAEFVLDWTLLYRTREEMQRLAAKLPPTAKVSVELEPGEAYYFLVVRRSE